MGKYIIELEKDYYEMIKYNVEHGQNYKPFEIIANGVPYNPKGEYVKGIVDALDKAFSLFDANSTYRGERVLQILEKLKWLEKLKEEKGSAK